MEKRKIKKIVCVLVILVLKNKTFFLNKKTNINDIKMKIFFTGYVLKILKILILEQSIKIVINMFSVNASFYYAE